MSWHWVSDAVAGVVCVGMVFGAAPPAAWGQGSEVTGVALMPAATDEEVPYTTVRLGMLGAASSWAEAVNERGQVAGTAETASGQQHSFLWDPDTGMRDLGSLGGGYSYAVDVNDLSQVAGSSRIELGDPHAFSGAFHAFLWDPATGMRDLGTLGGDWSEAVAVNARGQVAGTAKTASGDRHAFLWDPDTGMRDLGTLGGDLSGANALSDRGQVVGSARTALGASHAFLWDPATGMRDLGTLGGSESEAVDVNERGQVVGWARPESFQRHAFLWDPATGMRDLGTLGGLVSIARSVSERGQVAGHADGSSGRGTAFLWDPVSGMRDLGTPGENWSNAHDVNGRGQVVGQTWLRSGSGSYAPITFLWDPVAGMRHLGVGDPEDLNERGQVAGTMDPSACCGRAVLWTPSALAPRVSVKVAAVRGDRQLKVNVNPNRAAEHWTFRIQKRTPTGTWSTQHGTHRTKGNAETRTLPVPPGTYRVKVLPSHGYKGTTSAPVRLTPRVKVTVRAVAGASHLYVNVNPNKGTGYWTLRVQERRPHGTWTTLPTRYRTQRNSETTTINLPRGTYRVRVAAKYGYRGATSTTITLTR